MEEPNKNEMTQEMGIVKESKSNVVLLEPTYEIRETHANNAEQLPENVLIGEDDDEQLPSSSQDVQCDVMDPFFYTSVNIDEVNRDHTLCHHCGEDLTNRRFYNHLFDHHGYTKQQLDLMKTQKRIENAKKKKKELSLFICDCGTQFVSKNGLVKHKLRCHEIDADEKMITASVDNIVCPSYACEKNFTTYLDLAIHVDSAHRNLVTISDAFRIRRVFFQDKTSFSKWKRDMEKITRSDFFLRTTQKVTYAQKTALFKCQYSNSRGQPKGRRCEQCPAFIRTCERHSGRIEVVACFGHLGHEHETETAEAKELREIKWQEIEQKAREENILEESEQNVVATDDVLVVVDEVPNAPMPSLKRPCVDEHQQIADMKSARHY
ncbi:unnamed protein product [Caenorhabditis bovis]|uniref:C2H2-type domain-containing protein n=1 Tax=Caenorhabditis bovis TaxID=2654633 RepID=A0A8S1EYM8_9PELO|nr:unnamed protein product [Caenorhabditis bovis]